MVKMRASTELDNIASISKYIGHDPNRAKTKNDCKDFEYYKAAIKVGDLPQMDVVLNIWIHNNGEREFYDLSKWTKKNTEPTSSLANTDNKITGERLVTTQGSVLDDSKPQSGETVKKSFSISDAEAARDQEYMEAVESGDEAKQRRMLKEAPRAVQRDGRAGDGIRRALVCR